MNYALTGASTFSLFDRVIKDFADGDNFMVTFPNDKVALKTGKNGNSIFSQIAGGKNGEVVLRLLKGSADDNIFAGKMNQQDRDFSTTVLTDGQAVLNMGDGLGGEVKIVYELKGGMFKRGVDIKENQDGDTEQGVSVYTMVFASIEGSNQ